MVMVLKKNPYTLHEGLYEDLFMKVYMKIYLHDALD